MRKLMEKAINFLEKERLGLTGIFLLVLFFASVRTFTEAILFHYQAGHIGYYYIFYYYHIISFYIAMFVAGVTILKILTGEKLIRVANLAAIGFSLILLSPFIDYYIYHYNSSYTYLPKKEFIHFITFMYFKIHGVGGAGLRFQLIMILLLTSIYVYIKTSSIIKTVANLFLINLSTGFISTPTINPWIEKITLGYLSQPIYMVRYMVISLIFLFILIASYGKKMLKGFLHSMGLLRAFHFILMGAIGIWISGKINFSIPPSYKDAGNLGMFLITMFLLFFLWEYAMMLNNFYDIEIDRVSRKNRITSQKLISMEHVRDISIILAIISIFLSIAIGFQVFLLTLISLFLATIYSAPPVRLRNKMLSNSIIGIGSSLCFLIGYFTPAYIEINGAMHRIYSGITPDSIGISLLIFLVLTAGSLVKDIDDYEGDMRQGVKNIFTVYGIKKGLKIVSFPIFFSFLAPLIFIHSPMDFIFLLIFAIIAVIMLNKTKKSKPVFITYLIALLYTLFRYFS